ncbi:response regulator transcription factor [bacterium]|nr:response regulator transcription factor [bacterium]
MSKANILIIEDEEDIRELSRYNLEKEGYAVSCADSGEKAVQEIRKQAPDLILLDLMLPGMDGFEICKILKKDDETSGIPIIMVTAKSEEADIVTGLELGAEDYITKPFSPAVLLARVRTVLRRRQTTPADASEKIEIHNLSLDPKRFETRVDGKPVDLTATEFALLHLLARHPGWVFTRTQIIDAVKGSDYPVTDRSVDVQVVGLRKKLQSAGTLIQTVHGVGYRFME